MPKFPKRVSQYGRPFAGFAAKLAAVAGTNPKQPGTKEARYAHLLSGDVDAFEHAPKEEVPSAGSSPASERITRLENDITNLQREVAELRQQFAAFRKQFE